MNIKLGIAIIETPRETVTLASETDEGLHDEVYEWVKNNWNGDWKLSSDKDIAIAVFFTANEKYSLHYGMLDYNL